MPCTLSRTHTPHDTCRHEKSILFSGWCSSPPPRSLIFSDLLLAQSCRHHDSIHCSFPTKKVKSQDQQGARAAPRNRFSCSPRQIWKTIIIKHIFIVSTLSQPQVPAHFCDIRLLSSWCRCYNAPVKFPLPLRAQVMITWLQSRHYDADFYSVLTLLQVLNIITSEDDERICAPCVLSCFLGPLPHRLCYIFF